MAKRMLYVSGSRWAWAEWQDSEARYSSDAIGFNLERLGWNVAWCGWSGARNPLVLARRIDAFRPDIVHTWREIALRFAECFQSLMTG